MAVAAVVTSEATVTSVTTVTNINTFLWVLFKASKPFMAVTVAYGVGDADDGPFGGLFDLSLYCKFYNMATGRGAYKACL